MAERLFLPGMEPKPKKPLFPVRDLLRGEVDATVAPNPGSDTWFEPGVKPTVRFPHNRRILGEVIDHKMRAANDDTLRE